MEKFFEKMPKVKIANKFDPITPIIQGGMAIKVSTAKLAAEIANCGGLGLIAATGMTSEELKDQIQEARETQTNTQGLIGINVMFAASNFNEMVQTAIENGIDVIVFGAGFSRDIFIMGKEGNTPILPIVSSSKLAVISKKLGASSIILESGDAGGHLGTDKSTVSLIHEVREALDNTPDLEGIGHVPLIAAGGATTGFDVAKFFSLGAEGVQMGTRFVLSKECEVAETFKQLYLNIKESEVVKILSPVGLQARAIMNDFCKRILAGNPERPKTCNSCLKHCSRAFCIRRALNLAEAGDITNGLVFVGKNVCNIKEILPVKEIFANIEKEFTNFFAQQKGLIDTGK
ncbi:MAG: nitronate monooxygenase [Candidatus Gastranaerophilales bacterium]|nr:nitronate monooxygenase [Candidatus Gastranaerophilales bacterium]